MRQTVKDFVSMEKETFISSSSSPLRHYFINIGNPAKQQSDCKARTFCGTFCKNVARIECVIHSGRLYNDCLWLRKIQFAKNFSKIHWKFPVLEPLLNKVVVLQSVISFKKETQALTFSYELSGTFKSNSR